MILEEGEFIVAVTTTTYGGLAYAVSNFGGVWRWDGDGDRWSKRL